MLSFASGITYLRQEALKVGFIEDSDNDDKLVERLSQVIRECSAADGEVADEATKAAAGLAEEAEAKTEGEEVEPSSDKEPEGKA